MITPILAQVHASRTTAPFTDSSYSQRASDIMEARENVSWRTNWVHAHMSVRQCLLSASLTFVLVDV